VIKPKTRQRRERQHEEPFGDDGLRATPPPRRAMHARRLTIYKSLGFQRGQAAPTLVTAA